MPVGGAGARLVPVEVPVRRAPVRVAVGMEAASPPAGREPRGESHDQQADQDLARVPDAGGNAGPGEHER